MKNLENGGVSASLFFYLLKKQADFIVLVGSSVEIIGTSDAGKTTAVDILLGLLSPQVGQALADGVDMSENMPGWDGSSAIKESYE